MTSQIDILKRSGLKIQGNLGQHLLIDPNIQKKIVDLLSPRKDETILEIGPGLGALTAELLKRGACVIAIEKDERLIKVLEEELSVIAAGKLQIFHEDILKFNFRQVIQEPTKLVSNLPYYITAPILTYLIQNRDLFSEVVLMMQKEVSARLFAVPGSKDYGRLTLFMRYYAQLEHAFDVSPGCFSPKPQVDSSVIRLKFLPRENSNLEEEEKIFHLIKVAFSQRRKTFLGLLAKDKKIDLGRKTIAEIFRTLSWNEKARGEELTLKDFIALAGKIKDKRHTSQEHK